MTNEQKYQIAAMNADGSSISDIVAATGLNEQEVSAFVAERNAKNGKPKGKTEERKGGRKALSAELKWAVLEWYKMGNSEGKTAKKFGISESSVHRIITAAKEKEPDLRKQNGTKKVDTNVKFTDNGKSQTKGVIRTAGERQALEQAKKKLLAIYETLSPEETRAWEMDEVYAEVVRGLGE